ncbi:FadR/GntR family transcriptional regulator [Mesobacillus subterraneus]|uniref:FadR family transcriptional regulator n=1 Tax=Mesobacillus subterraneus TaxID=285983 RepID=A0A3R9FJK7_9BACI|nr:GntR family transcriptional regulator [Mesobacillus subterraneus]RSD27877.1 FadR family transcriptional regulator [Mesobacillus subterraneus]
MSQPEKNTKVYVEIVRQLREMIYKDELKPGDKIPSERELSERLNAGRSSVREALRALELLGLIETRRGEGTFIRDFRGNQLVQLLSTFILQDDKAKQDVIETKSMIEVDCLYLAAEKVQQEEIERLKVWIDEHNFEDEEFFKTIAELADNHLFYRIWYILNDYYNALNLKVSPSEKEDYQKLVDSLATKRGDLILERYRMLRKMSTS